jgi:protein MBA1
MSTHIPLRMARIPAQGLRHQCLFPRPRSSPAPRHFAASTARPFSATTARLRDPPSGYRLEDTALQDAAARNVGGPAPSVTMGKMMKEIDSMAEDIGLLQNTIIRAPLGQLPPVYNRRFWGYMWTLIKSRAASLWTRSMSPEDQGVPIPARRHWQEQEAGAPRQEALRVGSQGICCVRCPAQILRLSC